METRPARPPRPLLVVGGRLALDFANTVDDPDGPSRWDHIADYPALVNWSRRVGSLPPATTRHLERAGRRDPSAAADVVRRAADLRDTLGQILAAVLAGRSVGAGWARLAPVVAGAVAASVATGRDPVRFEWPGDELAAPVWAVAADAYGLLSDPELSRLKQCGNCPWFFLDRSKNHSRRWCSMEDCGTAVKIQRYVTRRAARTGGSGR